MCGYSCATGGYGCSTGNSYSSAGASYSAPANYNSIDSVVYQASNSYSSSSDSGYLSTSEVEKNFDNFFENLNLKNPKNNLENYKKTNQSYLQGYLQNNYKAYSFNPKTFLKDIPTKFIGKAEEIEDIIKETFRLTTGKELPDNITIDVCDENRFRKMHEDNNGIWNQNIQGFAVNRSSISSIFVKEGNLAEVMLTIGHEIGHLLSAPLRDPIHEEAKAFAFSVSWMKTIKENNIANLGNVIRLDAPAKNGIHNKALDFVINLVKRGKDSLELFAELVNGRWIEDE